MSLSDLDYVNAAVSRSEQQPRASANGSTTTITAGQTDAAAPERDAAEAESGSRTVPASSSSSLSLPAAAGFGEGRSAGSTDAAIQPSLTSLLASLQTATLDAQSLGTSLDPTTTTTEEENEQGDDDEEDLDFDSLKALLAKLDETEGAADDLEGRLDGLIDNLDALLGAMGGMALPDSSADTAAPTTEVKDEK